MTIIWPHVTRTFTAHLGDVIANRLSLAIWLIDDFTKQAPLGYVSLVIADGDSRAVQNLSGYYTVNDLIAGIHAVHIDADRYFPVDMHVDTGALDPKNPVVEVVLMPRSFYPFPANATLVRGIVANEVPVPDALISVLGKTTVATTDEQGEFVLFFKNIKKEDITIEIRKDGNLKTVSTTIEEGKTVSLGTMSFP